MQGITASAPILGVPPELEGLTFELSESLARQLRIVKRTVDCVMEQLRDGSLNFPLAIRTLQQAREVITVNIPLARATISCYPPSSQLEELRQQMDDLITDLLAYLRDTRA